MHGGTGTIGTGSSTLSARRILIIRLDRIGDVVLSTPVIRALRHAFPSVQLAMLVRPVCRELLDGHPDLNEVLCYDRDGTQHGWWATLRFGWGLRARGFDTALVLHPTNRSHVIAWAAGIPRRIGYARKSGWLLTQRLPHDKHLGARHESECALDLVRALGVAVEAVPAPSIAQRPEHREQVERWLAARGVRSDTSLIALHPSASDEAKRWPAERFAEAGDRLAAASSARAIVISGPEAVDRGREVVERMHAPPVDASGQWSLGQLAAALARCRLLISNDSGPVHIAAAVGTPVVSLFGRNQPGLGPARWGPVGARHVALHKDAPDGRCCTDARCPRPFLDVDALTVDDVVAVAKHVLAASAASTPASR